MANGTLLASPWAINKDGEPLDDSWTFGNLSESPLGALLSTPKARQFQSRLNQSFGHCRIHAFQNSPKTDVIDRIFDSTDPMWAPAGRSQALVPANFAAIPGTGGTAGAFEAVEY
ncbi:MAG: hypothetical protein NTW28_32540 [Candidatus Solibacter sp.]|nr:hypothetical protein [Candidatus Solibacter sp.]